VRLLRDVDGHGAPDGVEAVADDVGGGFGAAGGGKAGEVRHRSATDEEADRVFRIAQHFLEPVDGDVFDFGRGGAFVRIAGFPVVGPKS